MVYTLDSGSSGGNPVEVQVLSSAPTTLLLTTNISTKSFYLIIY